MIHAESLAAVGLPIADCRLPIEAVHLKSPGLLKKHYSPKAKLMVLSWRDELDLQSQIGHRQSTIGNVHIIAHTKIPSGFGAANVSVIPHDAEAYARALYAELYRCDAAGAKLIIVEAPPESPEWFGIADRLRRAAA
jgi:L-threonylcarbamoyladenylate synthase